MSNHDDFDLITEDEGEGGRSSVPYWLAGVAILLGFGFAVGLAFATLNNRLSPDSPAAVATFTPTRALVIGGSTATPAPASVAGDGSATPDSEGTPATVAATSPASPTPEPPTPTPTEIVCAEEADGAFQGAEAELGCPVTEPGRIVWAAWEPFERGAMLWRSDTDRAYFFVSNGEWRAIDEGWGGQDLPSRGAPPPGLFAPERGFGYVWSVRDDVFNSLGWATDTEKGFCARLQDFEQGFMLQSEAVASCTPDNLYNQATGGAWQPIGLLADASGRWRGSIGGGITPVGALPSGGATPPASGLPATPSATEAASVPTALPDAGDVSTVEQAMRPRELGRLFAPRAGSVRLDASFDDWSGDWIPVETLVYNVGDYGGNDDLSARAQFLWDSSGLYLALRVRDDRYRPAPSGTDQWQGDGIEINLDRRLAADFDDTQANEDDYQIGLALGGDTERLSGYRWLPYTREGSFTPAGAVEPRREEGEWRGYDLEVLLPWNLFDIDGAALPQQAALGFVLAINDNDGDAAAQESTLATSPARTRHDDPTQWGTLILLP